MTFKELIDPEFPSVSPLALVEQAACLMRDNQLHAIPVVDGEYLKGVIACEDLVYRGIADGEDWFLARVENYMTRDPDVALDTDDPSTIHAAMRAGRHDWLPVVTVDEEYRGAISLNVLEQNKYRKVGAFS